MDAVLARSQQRLQTLHRALRAAQCDLEAYATEMDTPAPDAAIEPLAAVRALTDRERVVLDLRYTPAGQPRRGSCAAAAARLRVSQPRVVQLSTDAMSKLVEMVR